MGEDSSCCDESKRAVDASEVDVQLLKQQVIILLCSYSIINQQCSFCLRPKLLTHIPRVRGLLPTTTLPEATYSLPL